MSAAFIYLLNKLTPSASFTLNQVLVLATPDLYNKSYNLKLGLKEVLNQRLVIRLQTWVNKGNHEPSLRIYAVRRNISCKTILSQVRKMKSLPQRGVEQVLVLVIGSSSRGDTTQISLNHHHNGRKEFQLYLSAEPFLV